LSKVVKVPSLDGPDLVELHSRPKSAGHGEVVDPRVRALMEKARQEGERIIAAARQQAEQILRSAETAKQQSMETGRAEGWEAGRSEGYRQGLAEAEELKQQAVQVMAEANAYREQTIMGMEREIVDLALAIAGRVIHKQVEADPELVTAVARQALRQVVGGKSVFLRVHPQQVELLQEKAAELSSMLPGGTTLQVVADPGIQPGGVMVESDEGWVDATLSSQLEQIREALARGE